MKRILLLLALCASISEAQVQVIGWSKAGTDDTAKVAGKNWGIRANFITFLDGSKFTTAINFYPFPNIADTLKYVEGPDSLKGAGYATRTMLQADSISRKAIQAADSTYKTAQIALKVNKADTTTESGGSYFTATQAKIDSTNRNVLLAKKIAYADTTAFPSIVPARNGQSGWLLRPAGWQYLTPSTATDTLRANILNVGQGQNSTLTPFTIKNHGGTNKATVDTLGRAMFGGTTYVSGTALTLGGVLSFAAGNYTVEDNSFGTSITFGKTTTGNLHLKAALAGTERKTTAELNNVATSWFEVLSGGTNNTFLQKWVTPTGVKASIDTSGNVSAGTGQFTTVRGSDTVKAGTASGATYSYFIPGGALVQSSDESLKTNIVPFAANLANFKLVTPRTYNFKKEVFLETFDRKSVPDSVDVRIDSVTTIRVSNLAAKDAAAIAFYVNNLAYAERKSQVTYRGFLANEFNLLLFGKKSKEINQQDEINVLWLKVQELEANQVLDRARIVVLEKR